jgi:hypothetical protein
MKLYLLRRAGSADRWANYEPMIIHGQEILGFKAFHRRGDAKKMHDKWDKEYGVHTDIISFNPEI